MLVFGCIVNYFMQHQQTNVPSQYPTIKKSLRENRYTKTVRVMEINRAILMCEWTMPLLVSLDIGTHVTN